MVKSTLMNTTPQATISALTLVNTVVLAVSTGNTCANADTACRYRLRTATANPAVHCFISPHLLSPPDFSPGSVHERERGLVPSACEELQDDPNGIAAEKESPHAENQRIRRGLIHAQSPPIFLSTSAPSTIWATSVRGSEGTQTTP